MNLSTFATRALITLTLALAPAALTGCAVDTVDYGQSDEYEVSAAKKAGRFELFVGQDGQHYFHLLAANGEKVLVSEGYTTKAAAQNGVTSCQVNGVDANAFDLQQAKNGEWYFNLLSGNGEVIATSELYTTKSNATKAIKTIAGIITKTAEVGAAPVAKPIFWTFRGIDGKYYFHLRAKNGQIVLQSQSYTTKASAKKGIDAVEANGVTESNFEVRDAADGRAYFVLVAQNGKVIGKSQMYGTKQGAERGIDAVVNLLVEAGESLPQ